MKGTSASPSAYARKRLFIMLGMAAALLAVTLLRYCYSPNMQSVDPTVMLQRTQIDESAPAQTPSATANLPDDGEVYRTADRLREASALALAAALYAASEQANQRVIRTRETLIARVVAAGLLPPGMTVDAAAMLLSDRSRLVLRFRADPFAVEVLSFPRSRDDGPALMIRIPALDGDGDRGSVFIADRLGDIDPPAPFASLADCVRAGWIDQQLNQPEIDTVVGRAATAWLARAQATPLINPRDAVCLYFTTSRSLMQSEAYRVPWMRLISPPTTQRSDC